MKTIILILISTLLLTSCWNITLENRNKELTEEQCCFINKNVFSSYVYYKSDRINNSWPIREAKYVNWKCIWLSDSYWDLVWLSLESYNDMLKIMEERKQKAEYMNTDGCIK